MAAGRHTHGRRALGGCDLSLRIKLIVHLASGADNNPALSRDKAGLLLNKAGLLDSGQYWTVDYKEFSRVPRVCAVRVRTFLEVLSTTVH